MSVAVWTSAFGGGAKGGGGGGGFVWGWHQTGIEEGFGSVKEEISEEEEEEAECFGDEIFGCGFGGSMVIDDQELVSRYRVLRMSKTRILVHPVHIYHSRKPSITRCQILERFF